MLLKMYATVGTVGMESECKQIQRQQQIGQALMSVSEVVLHMKTVVFQHRWSPIPFIGDHLIRLKDSFLIFHRALPHAASCSTLSRLTSRLVMRLLR